MTRYYDPDIIRFVSMCKNPVRLAIIAEMIAPRDLAAFYQISGSLTALTRQGVLTREKIDGKWHYQIAERPK